MDIMRFVPHACAGGFEGYEEADEYDYEPQGQEQEHVGGQGGGKRGGPRMERMEQPPSPQQPGACMHAWDAAV